MKIIQLPSVAVKALTTQKTTSDDDICITTECTNAANSIIEKLDESVKPCDDFYNFACGQYIKSTKIPDDKVMVDSFSVVRDELQDQLQTIITSPVDETEIEPVKMVKKLYKACMNKGEL